MKMSSMQVVFMFDLSACVDFLLNPKEELNRRLLSMRLACLRLLSDFSTKCSGLKWGVKFFDSQGSKNQIMCKLNFLDFSLENFETFESEICVRYERHISILQALLESEQNSLPSDNDVAEKEMNLCPPIKLLHLALTQVLCEFQWETMDMWSPSYTKVKKRRRNFLFIFSDFKDNDELLFKYFGLNSYLSKSKFLNMFLPQSLRDSILKKADINLVLLNVSEDEKFMGYLSSKVLPLLSDSLHSIHGSLIPLAILSQPLYNLKLLNDSETTHYQDEKLISSLPSGYQNSFLPFSTLFEQSLCYPFYSNADTLIEKCCINFTSNNLHIPIQIMEILNRKVDMHEEINMITASSTKSNCKEYSSSMWSKFNVYDAVSRSAQFSTYKVFLCLPNDNEWSSSETCCLQELNKNLSSEGLNLLLECITKDGEKLPGFLTPLSNDTAVISLLDPAIDFSKLVLDCKTSDSIYLKKQDIVNNFSNENQTFSAIKQDSSKNDVYGKRSTIKTFKMECMETKFKPKNLSSVATFISAKSSNKSLKMNMKMYSNLLKESILNSKSSKSKHVKGHPNNEPESNSVDQNNVEEEKSTEEVSSSDIVMKQYEELPSDISYEELLLTIKEAYNSALESSVNVLTASRIIMKMMINYCKKHSNSLQKVDINTMFKDNFLMAGQKITEKYETLDSKEAAERIIKECQIQILLNLEVESLRLSPDKSSCVNNINSLLRTAEFYFMYKETLQLDGLKERRNFLNDILKKNYSDNSYDILMDCIHEFEDSESSPGSPAETISSEFNNEEELFSSMISSTLSEKSSSSTGSYKLYKDIKEKNTLERKLLRRRSDISDTSRYRQVLLPKSSPKKKKAKVIANKAVRYSPRLAAKKSEQNKSACEKTIKARRKLFCGEKTYRTPKKNDNQSILNSKKKNISKTKLASETPSHKQNYSALQRRKSFIDQLSNSPKVIAESPKIRETAKDDASKMLLEKLQKASQEDLKSTNKTIEDRPKLPSFNEYTPESKRRLSLKLFSKFLSSPTARQGIKKCTKRLFDQISPQKAVENCKKIKNNDWGESSNSNPNNETQS